MWVSATEKRRQLTKKYRVASRRSLLLSAVSKFTLTEKVVFEQKIKNRVFLCHQYSQNQLCKTKDLEI